MLKPIELTGEQKRILFLPVNNPIQIKGVAGSGKTTVSLYRAKHLQDTQSNLYQPSKVVLFTFNRTLANYIEELIPVVRGGYQKESEQRDTSVMDGMGIQVWNFHRYAYKFLKEKGYVLTERNDDGSWDSRTVAGREQSQLIREALQKQNTYGQGILSKSITFFEEEISWMKGQMFGTLQDYLDAKRVGRGGSGRVTQQDKPKIWRVYTDYNSRLKALGKHDFDDYALLVLKEIKKPEFKPPFTHIVVDEAQDLSKAQILAISQLVSTETNSITIIADAAQRIYKSGFTWSDVGINVVGGRTKELKKNYRNTYEIFDAANTLILNDPDQSEYTTPDAPTRHGGKPILGRFTTWGNQMDFLVRYLKDKSLRSTVVLSRNWNLLTNIESHLRSEGFTTKLIKTKDGIDYDSDEVKLCTLSSVKGLEFDRVFICDVKEGVIPQVLGIRDDDDDGYHIDTERRLLYTAMTRAKQDLYLSFWQVPSPFLAEMDKSKFQIEGDYEEPLTEFDGIHRQVQEILKQFGSDNPRRF